MARDLGRTVEELRASLSSREMTEWIGFYAHEARLAEEARNR